MDHQERSSDLERDAERMDERADELEGRIKETKQDWESKKHDQSVPGAQPEGGDQEDDADASNGE